MEDRMLGDGETPAHMAWVQNATDTIQRSFGLSVERGNNRSSVIVPTVLRPRTPDMIRSPHSASPGASAANSTPKSPVYINDDDYYSSGYSSPGESLASPQPTTAFSARSIPDLPTSEPTPSRLALRRPRAFTGDELGMSLTSGVATQTSRNRMGSFSSSGTTRSLSPGSTTHRPSASVVSVPSEIGRRRPSRLSKRALVPSSPLDLPPPSVDSLLAPIPTPDPAKLLLLMKALSGRMRGEIDYHVEAGGEWSKGVAYIDEEQGSLVVDLGPSCPFPMVLVHDLRGIRVAIRDHPDKEHKCLDIFSPANVDEVSLIPVVLEEFDLWLAALITWQEVRSSTGMPLPTPSFRSDTLPGRSDLAKRANNTHGRAVRIVKAGKIMLWDRGLASSPRNLFNRVSPGAFGSSTVWRRVACVLLDNGSFKLMNEGDSSVISVTELSQLSRCSIQRVSKSLFDEENCFVIFPIYTTAATRLSVIGPIYLSLDSRVLHDVWLVLLKSFTIPDIYTFNLTISDQIVEVFDLQSQPDGEVFRLGKRIVLRITEAKITGLPSPATAQTPANWPSASLTVPAVNSRSTRDDDDPLVGNYLAEVVLDGEPRARTALRTGTKFPFWRDEYVFTDMPTTPSVLSVVVKRVYGSPETLNCTLQAALGTPSTRGFGEEIVGVCEIPLDKLPISIEHEKWLPVLDESGRVVGSLNLRVYQGEMAILPGYEYSPLSEIIHKFGTGLMTAISESIPAVRKRLCEILVNIFHVSGHTTEWFMSLINEEISVGSQLTAKKALMAKSPEPDKAVTQAELCKSLQGEATLLFRGNSLLTQALEIHMRRLGKDYLEMTLGEKIASINDANPDCEVNPVRLELDDESELERRWDQLLGLTNNIWDCIKSSVALLPLEVRQILRHVRVAAVERYGQAQNTVAYTSVSGFLFLRFICPAILNPKLFGLLKDFPRDRAQRTFTLIAKGLQGLSNLAAVEKKEPWMEPMTTRFYAAKREEFKAFVDQVCSTSSEKLPPRPASYSTVLSLQGRLSPLAREGVPHIPYVLDKGEDLALLARLWAQNMEGKPVVDELRDFDEVCKKLWARSYDCLARVNKMRTAYYRASQDMAELDSPLPYIRGSSSMRNVPSSNGMTEGLSSSGSPQHVSTPSYNSLGGPEFITESADSFVASPRTPHPDHMGWRKHSITSEVTTAGSVIRALRHGGRVAGHRFIPNFIRPAKETPSHLLPSSSLVARMKQEISARGESSSTCSTPPDLELSMHTTSHPRGGGKDSGGDSSKYNSGDGGGSRKLYKGDKGDKGDLGGKVISGRFF